MDKNLKNYKKVDFDPNLKDNVKLVVALSKCQFGTIKFYAVPKSNDS